MEKRYLRGGRGIQTETRMKARGRKLPGGFEWCGVQAFEKKGGFIPTDWSIDWLGGWPISEGWVNDISWKRIDNF